MLALFATTSAEARNLSFCYDPYPPYTLGEEGRPSGGSKVRLLEAVIERIDGVTATVELLPWKRCQELVKTGQLDGILPLFPNDERRSYMAFSEPTFLEEYVFFYHGPSFPEGLHWHGRLDEISHLTLGMLTGSYVDAEMERAFTSNGRIQRAASIQSLLMMLRHNRVDLVATDNDVGLFRARELDLSSDIIRMDHAITARASRFGLSLKTGASQYVEAFNAALAGLRETGDLDRIKAGE
ncbi:MAG: transporter substrate-binding domain-containing protein [Pseudomonadota bacterium]